VEASPTRLPTRPPTSCVTSPTRPPTRRAAADLLRELADPTADLLRRLADPRRHVGRHARELLGDLSGRIAERGRRAGQLRRCLPRPPPDRGPALRVGRGDEQAAQQSEVLQEVDLLLRTDLGVVLLPEPVPRERGGDERRGERRGGEPGELAERQHRARDDLHTCVDLDEHLVVGALVEIERSDLDGLVHRGADRLEYRLRGPRMGLRRA
jgi:hypothetical protein